MRLILTALAVLSLLVVPLASAEVHPKALVLQQADVPSRFKLDRSESGVRTNALESKSGAEARRMIVRSGRITGYENAFDRHGATIESRADLFKAATGARIVLSWFDREVRKSGIAGLERSRMRIGDEGWLFTGRSPAVFNLVVWRYDRVVAGVVATLPRETVLALARVQQQRVAAALR